MTRRFSIASEAIFTAVTAGERQLRRLAVVAATRG